MTNNKWIPEIMYEESREGVTNGFPFIDVPEDKSMPACLFICEARKVSEENTEVEKELTFHSYANMTLLKQELDQDLFDKVRSCLGFKPLKEAYEEGKNITENVNNNINS